MARSVAQRALSFLGIELLNEPTSVDVNILKQYYITSYNVIRIQGNKCVLVTSSILWEQNEGTASNWKNFMMTPDYALCKSYSSQASLSLV